MIRGIQSGMVMQRGEAQRCRVWFRSDEEVTSAQCLNDAQPLTVERDGDRYLLRGLFVGGPYTLRIGGEVFEEVYVVDLWLPAGQSNMQGVGRIDHGVAFNTDHISAPIRWTIIGPQPGIRCTLWAKPPMACISVCPRSGSCCAPA